jgi:hypothetical protein
LRRFKRLLLLSSFNDVCLRILMLVCVGHNSTEPINGGAHRLDIVLRPRELSLIAFAIEKAIEYSIAYVCSRISEIAWRRMCSSVLRIVLMENM